jgi:glycosyltransferase involved in cell wall biosynthesis
MARICIVTPGQPAINPRVVKEADALVGAGHEVRVIAAYYVPWAAEADRQLLASRSWTCVYVGGTPTNAPVQYRWTRARQALSKRLLPVARHLPPIAERSLARVGPELELAARRWAADLYIGHNLAALPVVVRVADSGGVPAGYDAEDFLLGMRAHGAAPSPMDRVVESVEQRYLPCCSYITAASPGIAQAYADSVGIPTPLSILNVFPLAERPKLRSPSSPDGPLTLYWFSQTIGPLRGLEDAVRAMGLLHDCAIELHLRGAWQSGYREQLMSLVASAGTRLDRIVAHASAPPGDMLRLAASYDVGLALEHPSSEARDLCLTNKLFTYLLAGNAIAGTATSGQRPILNAIGNAAIAYEPGDVASLASALDRWYRDRSALEAARQRAWEWGSRRYNWDLEKEKFLDIVDRTLAGA